MSIYVPQYRRGMFDINSRFIARSSEKPRQYSDIKSRIKSALSMSHRDKYAVVEVDYLILGGDALLALLCAMTLRENGYTTLIEPSFPEDMDNDYQSICRDRFTMESVLVERYLSSRHEHDILDGVSIIHCISSIARDKSEGMPKIMITEPSYTLRSNPDKDCNIMPGPRQIFWADPGTPNKANDWEEWKVVRHMASSLGFIMSPSREEGFQERARPHGAVVASNIITTSFLHSDTGQNFAVPVIGIGESAAPLATMTSFKERHRLLDVMSAKSVLSLASDSNLHHEMIQQYQEQDNG